MMKHNCSFCKDLPYIKLNGETGFCPECDCRLKYTKLVEYRVEKCGEKMVKEGEE